jgi:hypothetical protein
MTWRSKLAHCSRRQCCEAENISFGSGSATTNLSIFNQKKLLLSSRKYDPGRLSWITDLDFFFHPRVNTDCKGVTVNLSVESIANFRVELFPRSVLNIFFTYLPGSGKRQDWVYLSF